MTGPTPERPEGLGAPGPAPPAGRPAPERPGESGTPAHAGEPRDPAEPGGPRAPAEPGRPGDSAADDPGGLAPIALDPGPEGPDGLPPEPHRRLAPGVVTLWMAGGAGSTIVTVLVASILLPLLDRADGAPRWAVPLGIALVGAYGIAAVFVSPVLRYRHWRYAVREDELDLVRGALVRTRTIVPMARVQHVDTAQTPLGRSLGIASLKVHTAAAAHEIPGLRRDDAYRLRTEIARRARVADEV